MGLFERQLEKCGQDITLQNRDIQAPAFGSADFDESFSADLPVRALISTERGKTLFDGVAVDNPITHKVCIAYVAGVTAETWVLLANGHRLDILDVENCCEKDERLILRCTDRGSAQASKA
jgi:hypothetical protein